MIGARFIDPCLIGAGIVDYIDQAVSPLKPIPAAIYNCRVAKSVRNGFGKIFRIPSFLKKDQSEHSRLVLYESFLANVTKYLLPVVMYKRAVNVMIDKSPDFFDPVIVAADWIVCIAIFGRLFLRRLVDNSINSINLYKAVSKDVSNYLSEMVADNLAELLSPELAKIFSDSNQNISAQFQDLLKEKMRIVFKKFFSGVISKKSLPTLTEDLGKAFFLVFYQVMQSVEQEKITEPMAEKLAKILASAISDELSGAIFGGNDQARALTYERDATKVFSEKFMSKSAQIFSKQLLQRIHDLCAQPDVQLYLPDKTLNSCDCAMDKTLKGALSSTLYYTGLTWLTFAPNAAESVGLFNVHWSVYMATYLLRALLYGQSFNETRFNAAGLCARHRYYAGAANKIRFTSEGLAYLADIEFMAFLVRQLTDIDNFFVRDALANFLLYFHLMPNYTFHAPLAPAKKNPFDIFLPGREFTRATAYYLKSWMFPNLNDEKARKECIRQFGSALNSDQFSYLHLMLFGPSDFFPLSEWRQIQEERAILKTFSPFKLDSTKKIEAQRDEIAKALSRNSSKQGLLDLLEANSSEKIDRSKLPDELKKLKLLRHARKPTNVLLDNVFVNIFFELSHEDIGPQLETVELLRKMSNWLDVPLSILPIQGGIITLLELPLQFLQNDVSQDILRALQLKISEAKTLQGAFRAPSQEAKYYFNNRFFRKDEKSAPIRMLEHPGAGPLVLSVPNELKRPPIQVQESPVIREATPVEIKAEEVQLIGVRGPGPREISRGAVEIYRGAGPGPSSGETSRGAGLSKLVGSGPETQAASVGLVKVAELPTVLSSLSNIRASCGIDPITACSNVDLETPRAIVSAQAAASPYINENYFNGAGAQPISVAGLGAGVNPQKTVAPKGAGTKADKRNEEIDDWVEVAEPQTELVEVVESKQESPAKPRKTKSSMPSVVSSLYKNGLWAVSGLANIASQAAQSAKVSQKKPVKKEYELRSYR